MPTNTTPERQAESAPISRCPWPVRISGTGDVNGETFEVDATGNIPTLGVYRAAFEFSEIPAGLHPSPVALLGLSTSCFAQASTRHGAKNLSARGVEQYDSTRVLSLDRGELAVDATSKYLPDRLEIDLHVTGEIDLPDDLAGHSSYFVRVEPSDDGRLVGVGETDLHRDGGTTVESRLDSEYRGFQPAPIPDSLDGSTLRVVTEHGDLEGTTYSTQVHSLLDGGDPAAALLDETPRFE